MLPILPHTSSTCSAATTHTDGHEESGRFCGLRDHQISSVPISAYGAIWRAYAPRNEATRRVGVTPTLSGYAALFSPGIFRR